MKKNYAFFLLALIFAMTSFAQVQNVYVAAGGSFSNPDDYVVVKKVNPSDYSVTPFNTIYTQAVTDMLIYGDQMFVAAMDSLVAYDLTTGTRSAAIAVSNTNKLSMVNNQLWLTRQAGSAGPPADGVYVKVFDPQNLSLVMDIANIDADAAYVNYFADSIYITVPGDWSSTTGKLAVLDLDTYTVQRVIDMGEGAVGIFNIYHKNDKLWITCKTPYLGTNGSFVEYDPVSASFEILYNDAVFGFGAGMDEENDRSFLLYNNTIAWYDFNNAVFTEVAPDPGSANWISYASAAYENESSLLWANYTDYYSSGTGVVYNLSGEQVANFDIGISPEAMAFHYSNSTAIDEIQENILAAVYPNPSSGIVTIEAAPEANCVIIDSNGRIIRQFITDGVNTLSLDDISRGMYFVKVQMDNTIDIRKLIIQ